MQFARALKEQLVLGTNIRALGDEIQTLADEAELARDLSELARDEAVAAKDLAVAAWAASTAPAEQLASIDTSFFPVTTLVTAIVGSTRDDWDGGAWRKQCQDKSWYNETIYGNQIGIGYYANEAAARAAGGTTNDYYYDTTANVFRALNAGSGVTEIFRGGRREFPENFIVTVEAARVVIWDTDFGAPRMWMVFTSSATSMLLYGSVNRNSCSFRNGVLSVGGNTGAGSGNLVVINFIRDDAIVYAGLKYPLLGSILSRNGSIVLGTGVSLTIVNPSVNAVAITTLPNAPLDEYGIPKPTIAVGTDGGVTVLGWDGVADNVAWDIVVTGNTFVTQVGFGADNRVSFTIGAVAGRAIWLITGPIPTADQSFANTVLPAGYSSLYGTGDVDQNLAIFPSAMADSATYYKVDPIAGNNKVRATSSSGLEIFRENPSAPTRGMGAKITHTFNSGICVGDIRRAWLADTTAETITADTPLSATFDSDVEGFAAQGTAVVTWDAGGKLSFQKVGTGDRAGKEIACVIGKTYTVTTSVDAGPGTARFYVGTSAGGTGVVTTTSQPTAGSAQTWSASFVATATTLHLSVDTDTNVTRLFDNITVKLAEPDRCIKNRPLTVVGSLNKVAVASGANLVAYSGFSASNYLEEAYSSDLDFGTGAHGRVFWLKEAANSAEETIFQRDSASTAQRIYARVNAAGTITFGCDDNTTDRAATSTVTVDDGLWHLYWCRYDGAGGVYIYRDGSSSPIASATGAALLTLNNASAYVRVGVDSAAANPLTNGLLVMKRVTATDMTMQQWAEMYEQEKKLFEPNAQCTLAGTSSAVLAVDHDDVTNITSVLTSFGRSDFKGLVRVASEATAVGTPRAVSAHGGAIVQVGSTGIDYYAPQKNLREEMRDVTPVRESFEFTATAGQTTFPLPYGWRAVQERDALWQNGTKRRFGTGNAWTQPFDGFIFTPTLAVGATVSDWISIEAERWL